MRNWWALLFILLATAVAVSGCMDFGALPDTPPVTPTPMPTPTSFVMPGAIGLVPGTQVDATLKQPIDLTRTKDMKQTENLTLTLKNTGAANATHVYFSIKVKDGQTSKSLYTDMVSLGNITPGGTAVRTISVPAHPFIYFIVVQTVVYWGDNVEFGNELQPWYISL